MRNNLFKVLSLATGLLYLWLFYQLLFTPADMLKSFSVEADVHSLHLAQRISVLMLGFAVLLFLSFKLQTSRFRAAVALSVSVCMAGFAINSFSGAIHGILTDSAIPWIGVIETLIALGFAGFAVSDFLQAKRAEAKP